MTTVAALVSAGGVVHMAADSMTNVYERPVYTARKIIRQRVGGDHMLLGIAGDGAVAGLLRHDLEWPELGADDDLYLHRLAGAITSACQANQIGLTDGVLSSSVLIGWRGRLHHLGHAQVVDLDTEVGAIGRGEEPAMATMLALLKHTGLAPQQVLREAVEMGARLAPGTGGRVDYQTTLDEE